MPTPARLFGSPRAVMILVGVVAVAVALLPVSEQQGQSLVLDQACSGQLSAPACTKVISELTPCLSFVKKGGSSAPSSACCSGVGDVAQIAKTNSDRSAVCRCLKQVLPAAGGSYDPSRIPLLPKECGVSINLPPIDSKTDCSRF